MEKKKKFDALCMESSRVKQIEDKIHYYVSQLECRVNSNTDTNNQ